jgi:hypothetical protein
MNTATIFAILMCFQGDTCYTFPTNYNPRIYKSEADCTAHIEPVRTIYHLRPERVTMGCVSKTIPVATPWEPTR